MFFGFNKTDFLELDRLCWAERARLAEDGEEEELVRVVRGRGFELVDVCGEEVGALAVGAPRGEAGGDPVVVFQVVDGVLEGEGIWAVDEDAGVGRPELVADACAAAWHAPTAGE